MSYPPETIQIFQGGRLIFTFDNMPLGRYIYLDIKNVSM